MFKKGIVLYVLPLAFLVFACSNGLPGGDQSRQGDIKWNLVWSDEFDGDTVDSDKWEYDIGNGFRNGDDWISGWGNEELEYYTQENASIDNGELVITAKKEKITETRLGFPRGTFDYTSAKLKSKHAQAYGRFEIRAKLPKGQGLWPAIWMLSKDNSYGGWAGSGEIDIMEARGSDPTKVHGTIHYGAPWSNNAARGKEYSFPSGEDFEAFHVYALEWTPGAIKWYVDDVLFHTETFWYSQKDTATHELHPYPAPFDKAFYLIVNLAVGGRYGGNPDGSYTFPKDMRIDYVRIYESQNGYPSAGKRPEDFYYWDLEEVRESLGDGNLVYNGGFDWTSANLPDSDDSPASIEGVANSYYWTDLSAGGGQHTSAIEDGVYHISISNEGTLPYSNQLLQGGLHLEKDYQYEVSFEAWSDKARTMSVKVGAGGDRGWLNFSGDKQITLSTTKTAHTFTFSMTKESYARAQIEFNMGKIGTGDIYLDNVKVIRSEKVEARKSRGDGNLVHNGDFDSYTDLSNPPEPITGLIDKGDWSFYRHVGVAKDHKVTPSIENGALKIAVIDVDSKLDWYIQILQKNIPIEKGASYTVSFEAWASDERTITALVGTSGEPYTRYGEQQIALTTTQGEHSFDFTMTDSTNLESIVQFLLANGSGNYDVYLDNIKVIKK